MGRTARSGVNATCSSGANTRSSNRHRSSQHSVRNFALSPSSVSPQARLLPLTSRTSTTSASSSSRELIHRPPALSTAFRTFAHRASPSARNFSPANITLPVSDKSANALLATGSCSCSPGTALPWRLVLVLGPATADDVDAIGTPDDIPPAIRTLPTERCKNDDVRDPIAVAVVVVCARWNGVDACCGAGAGANERARASFEDSSALFGPFTTSSSSSPTPTLREPRFDSLPFPRPGARDGEGSRCRCACCSAAR